MRRRLKDAINEAQAEREGRDPLVLELERTAQELWNSGVDFRVQNGQVYLGERAAEHEATIDLGTTNRMKLGIVSDTHFGSRFEQLSALKDFYRIAEEEGVDAFIHAGDLVQGTPKMHRGMEHEVHLHSADGQINYTIDVYPESDLPTYFITGNHDDSFINESGTNPVRAVTNARPEFHYVGQDASYLNIDGLRIYVVHPSGGLSYAKSYRPQKITEAIPIDKRTHIVIIGHYHTYGVFKVQETIAVMEPCFQGSYPWLIRKGLYPTIGGHIMDIEYDDDRITRISHTLVDYPEKEDDFDTLASSRWQRPGAV